MSTNSPRKMFSAWTTSINQGNHDQDSEKRLSLFDDRQDVNLH